MSDININEVVLKSNIDVNVSRDDLINLMTVAYEKNLRNEQKRLNQKVQDINKEKVEITKRAHKELLAFIDKKLVNLIATIGGIMGQINRLAGVANDFGIAEFKKKPYYFDEGVIGFGIDENGEFYMPDKFEVSIYPGAHISFPPGGKNTGYAGRFNSSTPLINKIKIPATYKAAQKKLYDKTLELNEVSNELSKVAADLRDVEFNAKLVRAKITEQVLNSTEKGKKLLSGVKSHATE